MFSNKERRLIVYLHLAISICILCLLVFAVFTPLGKGVSGEGALCYLELKYVIYDANSFEHIEVVDHLWINGAIEYNNRPFTFRQGEVVSLTAPEEILGAKFAFWQRQDSKPTFQGEIVTQNILTITLTEQKTIWWANYSGDLSSL